MKGKGNGLYLYSVKEIRCIKKDYLYIKLYINLMAITHTHAHTHTIKCYRNSLPSFVRKVGIIDFSHIMRNTSGIGGKIFLKE